MFETNQLTLKFRPGLRLTDRAFWKLCAANPDLRLERTARGELVIMPPAGSDSGRRNMDLGSQLWVWNRTSQLGVCFDSSSGFRLPNGATRLRTPPGSPSTGWDAVSPEQQRKFAPICPDFVAELRSPTDDLEGVRDKMREYIDQGVRLGWLIDPAEDKARLRSTAPAETLNSS